MKALKCVQIRRYQRIIQLFLALVIWTTAADAQWSWDPAVNNAISVTTGDQNNPEVCPDGSGGAIITWRDERSGLGKDVYAQRISAGGAVQWTTNGIPICTAPGDQDYPIICSDGSGGAIIAWRDYRVLAGIYAQRINSMGIVQWPLDGVLIKAGAVLNDMISDGAGGAIITYGASYDIYAQRINASGLLQWMTGGVSICSASNTQDKSTLCTDGSGGAIISWQDWRSSNSNADVYSQKVDATGNVQWAVDGLPICTHPSSAIFPQICSDGAGGAIIAWTDCRPGQDYDIYAQRVDHAGATIWTANGIAVCTASGVQGYGVHLCSDGQNGAIITWNDERTGPGNTDVYAQRISAAGNPIWPGLGIAIATGTGEQRVSAIQSVGNGDAIIILRDDRYGYNTWDHFAQLVHRSSGPQWTANGIEVCIATGQQNHAAVCGDGAGGAIVAWVDRRGPTRDIYASRVSSIGQLYPVELLAFAAAAYPGGIYLSWRTSDEVNNNGFEVQRRVTSGDWIRIGFVPALTQIDTDRRYSYLDELNEYPLVGDRLYYRLKQIDHSGQYTYSPVIEVQLDAPIHQFSLSGYPLPCDEKLTVQFTLQETVAPHIRLFDIHGRQVWEKQSHTPLTPRVHSLEINTSQLRSGRYVLVIGGNEGWRSAYIVVQH